jgi:hypothetical protein
MDELERRIFVILTVGLERYPHTYFGFLGLFGGASLE